MPIGYQIKDQAAVYYLTLQVVEWVDVFTRQRYRDIVTDSFNYCVNQKNLQVFAYVIMSNHIHLLVRAGDENLSDVIRDFKRHTSKNILTSIEQEPESRKQWMLKIFSKEALKHKRNQKFQFWTHENHAVELYSPKFMKEKLIYLHNNPVRSGLVNQAEDFIYSSATDYAGKKALVDVVVVINMDMQQ